MHVYAPASRVPHWIKVEHLPQKAVPGARLFQSSGCLACHRYAGSGTHLKCPSCVNPGSPMPPFASLGRARLHELAVFLEASRGTH